MKRKYDFKRIDSGRNAVHDNSSGAGSVSAVSNPEVVVPEVLEQAPATATAATHPITQAVAGNFSKILEIACQCIEIQKIQVLSEKQLKELRENRELLAAEAEAYVKKKDADTNTFVEKAEKIRLLLADYYKYNGSEKLPSGDFIKVLEKVLEL